MRVTITGASGLIGTKLTKALEGRGDEVIPVSVRADVDPAKVGDAVIHLAGENVAQRWTDEARERIEQSRVQGTRRIVKAINEAGTGALISSSAVGYYGPHGDEKLDETAPAGDTFLAQVCVAWENEADLANTRVVKVRTGVVLDPNGGALSKMLLPFKLGMGGPVAGGKQYMPWIHIDDVVGIYLKALDDPTWSGPVNATAPEPVTNADFGKALGKALHRPAVAPIPGFAIKALYGDMAMIVTEGQRVIPRRTLELGYVYTHPDLGQALEDVTA